MESFDYVNAETVYVTEITGGNDTLAATDSRQASLGVSLGPFLGKTEFLARYETSWTSNAIGALPPTTEDVELAFPDRFVRDADGATPTAFEPGYLDPPGRVLALTVRKVI